MNLLLITGSMGAGKTTTLAEASDLLTERRIPHAAIDLDALGVCYLDPPRDPERSNLRCVCANYAEAGIDRLLLASAVETQAELRRIVDATSAQSVVICRLRAPLPIMESRVSSRERGVFAATYQSRVAVLERILDASSLEHFTVDADRPVTTVARDLLQAAGWID